MDNDFKISSIIKSYDFYILLGFFLIIRRFNILFRVCALGIRDLHENPDLYQGKVEAGRGGKG